MVLIEANRTRKLFHLSFVGHVTRQDLASHYGEIEAVLADFSGGFRLLGDLTALTSMDQDCTSEIGRVMELLEAKGMEMVVRVIPDPRKDIGLSILSVFHYSRKVRPVTCETLEEALKILGM